MSAESEAFTQMLRDTQEECVSLRAQLSEIRSKASETRAGYRLLQERYAGLFGAMRELQRRLATVNEWAQEAFNQFQPW